MHAVKILDTSAYSVMKSGKVNSKTLAQTITNRYAPHFEIEWRILLLVHISLFTRAAHKPVTKSATTKKAEAANHQPIGARKATTADHPA